MSIMASQLIPFVMAALAEGSLLELNFDDTRSCNSAELTANCNTEGPATAIIRIDDNKYSYRFGKESQPDSSYCLICHRLPGPQMNICLPSKPYSDPGTGIKTKIFI